MTPGASPFLAWLWQWPYYPIDADGATYLMSFGLKKARIVPVNKIGEEVTRNQDSRILQLCKQKILLLCIIPTCYRHGAIISGYTRCLFLPIVITCLNPWMPLVYNAEVNFRALMRSLNNLEIWVGVYVMWKLSLATRRDFRILTMTITFASKSTTHTRTRNFARTNKANKLTSNRSQAPIIDWYLIAQLDCCPGIWIIPRHDICVLW